LEKKSEKNITDMIQSYNRFIQALVLIAIADASFEIELNSEDLSDERRETLLELFKKNHENKAILVETTIETLSGSKHFELFIFKLKEYILSMCDKTDKQKFIDIMEEFIISEDSSGSSKLGNS